MVIDAAIRTQTLRDGSGRGSVADRREERFEAIYRAYERPVYAYLRRRADVASARDCAAETFLVAWRRLGDVPDGERTLPWLYGTARRVLSNHRRSRDRFARLLQKSSSTALEAPEGPETIVVRRAEDEQVLEALRHVRKADRELLMLAFWEEVPRDELAEMHGCTAHAVNQRIHRALRRLARHLDPPGHIPGETALDRAQRGSER